MFNTIDRNYENIQFAEIRKVVDVKFNQAHDELSAAYYNFWKIGLSKPWKGYDKQATPEESQLLFEKLHGLIFHLREIALEEEYLNTPKSKRDVELQVDFDSKVTKDDGMETTKIQFSKDYIQKLKTEGIELII